MNIRLKFEILTFSAAPETHFASIPMLGGANSTFVGFQPFKLWIMIMNYVSVVAKMSHILYISIRTDALTCILSWLLSNENARYLCIVQLECEVDLLKVGHLSIMATNH